ncbi:MAG: alpha/beta fold hydrolase [Chitinophagales bacterium]|nr:alpha/beta fold hydrolase [Chitinophagales bacterium]
MKFLVYLIIILIAVYTVLLIIMYVFQERLIFFYHELDDDHRFEFPVEFEERFFDTPGDGLINALHFKIPEPKGVVLYFHGNTGTLAEWGEVHHDFNNLAYDLLIYDYRKFGKSKGKISQETLLSDAEFLYNIVVEEYGEDKVVLYGRSLGSGISCYLASKFDPKLLFLETPYYSLSAVGAGRYPFMPVKWLSKFPMPSFRYIAEVDCPIYIIHGTKDYVIPLKYAQQLCDSSNGKAEMVIVKGAEHNNLEDFDEYHELLKKALR